MSHRRERHDRRVTVIGLGRFGRSVARTLYELGYEVTAVDRDERQVEEANDFGILATQGDGTDEELLRSLQVDRSAAAIVAQGTHLESNVMATLVLKRLGVPYVVAPANSMMGGEVLRHVGADRVIDPEHDAGVHVAHTLAVSHFFVDYIPLSPTNGVANVTVPPNLVGRTLADVHANCGAQLSILALVRGQQLTTTPGLDEQIQDGDALVIVGPHAAIETLLRAGMDASAT
jgi:trk system potassium uptake protein TrkA